MPRISKFELVDSDIDYKVGQRTMSGRMTEGRHRIVQQWCERNTWREHCHHEWDCCGCHFADHASYEYKHNQLIITITASFNY